MKICTILTYFFLLASTAIAQDPWKDVYKESAWKQRDEWQRPQEIIAHLGLKSGDVVADIGSHEGYFTVKLSKAVGDAGKVYAVDIDKGKLQRLKQHLGERNIKNVIVTEGDEDNPKLPPNTLDAVLIVDTYHEMDAHDAILQHIKNALKEGGRLLICEPISETRKTLSRAEQERKHEVGINYALDDLKKAGFKVMIREEDFVDRTKEKGDMMWVIVASK